MSYPGNNPPQGYTGYPPQQGYGGYPPQQGYGGYPPQQGYGQGPPGLGAPEQGPPPGQGLFPQQGPPPQQPYPQPGQPGPGQPPPQTQLPPVQSILNVFGSHYALPYETTLIMREGRSMTNEDMDVSDAYGRIHFRLRCKFFSMQKKRVLYDLAGQPLCSLMKKMFSIHGTTFICPGAEPHKKNALVEVRKVVLSLAPCAHVFVGGKKKGSVPDMIIQGSFMEYDFQIIQESTGLMLAQVHRSQSAMNYMTGLDTYALRVFPRVDLALMVALVIVIEEVFVEETKT